MTTLSYIMGANQMALLRKQDRIADQIANINTTAFKLEKDLIAEKKLRLDDGNEISFMETAATIRDYSQGDFSTTGRGLDVAIAGEGFFMVDTPLGQRYTRAGNFTINEDGQLVTKDGYLVLGPGGQQTEFSPEDSNIQIKDDGIVSVNNEDRGQIGVFVFDNPEQLKRTGNGYYTTEQNAHIQENAKIHQGMLENSNVSPILQFTELINLSRDMANSTKVTSQYHDQALDSIRRLAENS